MLIRFLKQTSAIPVVVVLAGCAVTLPPAPAADPANPGAPEAATAPLRPQLLASSRNFLTPAAADRAAASKMKTMNMQGSHAAMGAPAAPSGEYYTCPMHAEIHQQQPGECPICGMNLIKTAVTPEKKP